MDDDIKPTQDQLATQGSTQVGTQQPAEEKPKISLKVSFENRCEFWIGGHISLSAIASLIQITLFLPSTQRESTPFHTSFYSHFAYALDTVCR